jgi:hypothetical protein
MLREEVNIKMELKEAGCQYLNRTHMTQVHPVVSSCEHSDELLCSLKSRKFLD